MLHAYAFSDFDKKEPAVRLVKFLASHSPMAFLSQSLFSSNLKRSGFVCCKNSALTMVRVTQPDRRFSVPQSWHGFYRASYAKRGLGRRNSVCPSVRPFVLLSVRHTRAL